MIKQIKSMLRAWPFINKVILFNTNLNYIQTCKKHVRLDLFNTSKLC